MFIFNLFIFFNILKVHVMKPSLLYPWYASFIDGKMISCIHKVRKINKNYFFFD